MYLREDPYSDLYETFQNAIHFDRDANAEFKFKMSKCCTGKSRLLWDLKPSHPGWVCNQNVSENQMSAECTLFSRSMLYCLGRLHCFYAIAHMLKS
jgi:hypothetical protein